MTRAAELPTEMAWAGLLKIVKSSTVPDALILKTGLSIHAYGPVGNSLLHEWMRLSRTTTRALAVPIARSIAIKFVASSLIMLRMLEQCQCSEKIELTLKVIPVPSSVMRGPAAELVTISSTFSIRAFGRPTCGFCESHIAGHLHK
jgi:hypothetical protein